ncbi:MAG: T9SS type A sorting domain-containing protein [Flammeovirgaceae bacterium]
MKTLFSILVLLTLSITGKSQTVYTCKGGTVGANNYSAGTSAQKNAWRQAYLNWASLNGMGESNILAEADGSYNCHSYAWHLREGNSNKVWINNTNGSQNGGCYINNDNINKYWTDGCFIQVCNQSEADKTHYYCGDHSAVTSTTVSGKYESKWGAWPVVRHNPTTVPYSQPSTVRYYASTKIIGNASTLCSGTRTLSIKTIAGAGYSWSVNSALQIVSGQGTNQLTVQRNGSSNDIGIVTAVITSPCSSISASSQFQFGVGAPQVYGVTLNSTSCIGGSEFEASYSITGSLGATFNVSIPPSSNYYVVYATAADLYVSTSPNIFIPMDITPQSACGLGPVYGYGFYTNSCSYGGGLFSVSPNPASTQLTVKYESMTDTSSSMQKKATGQIESAILEDELGRIHVQSTDKSESITLGVSSVPDGIYYLHVSLDGKTEIRRVVIKK